MLERAGFGRVLRLAKPDIDFIMLQLSFEWVQNVVAIRSSALRLPEPAAIGWPSG